MQNTIDVAAISDVLTSLVAQSNLGAVEATFEVGQLGRITVEVNDLHRHGDILAALGLTVSDNVRRVHITEFTAEVTRLVDDGETTDTIYLTWP